MVKCKVDINPMKDKYISLLGDKHALFIYSYLNNKNERTFNIDPHQEHTPKTHKIDFCQIKIIN